MTSIRADRGSGHCIHPPTKILGKGTASGITLMMTAAHTSTSVRAATTAAKAADSLSLPLSGRRRAKGQGRVCPWDDLGYLLQTAGAAVSLSAQTVECRAFPSLESRWNESVSRREIVWRSLSQTRQWQDKGIVGAWLCSLPARRHHANKSQLCADQVRVKFRRGH